MERAYLDLLKDFLENGEDRGDRTGTGTRSVFGRTIRCNLADGFPALTTKKLFWKPVVGELLWFLEGSQNNKRLAELTYGDGEHDTIWTGNANANYWMPKASFPGDVGRIYGVQWRRWKKTQLINAEDHLNHDNGGTTYFNAKVRVETVDQIAKIIHTIKTNPTDRRMVLTAFNVGEMEDMSLPPCHYACQFYVNMTRKLNCMVQMRSVDLALGLPFNIASYALLTHLIAHVTNLGVGELIFNLGDAHIYSNHFEGVREQLSRKPLDLPTLKLNSEISTIDNFKMPDIELVDYQCYPTIQFKMAV